MNNKKGGREKENMNKSDERRNTDCIAKKVDINKIVPKRKPWTKEEVEKARLANIAKSKKKGE